MGKNMILTQYLDQHFQANEKYNKSVVLMQVGSFSEIYGTLDNKGPDLNEISNITNCSIAIKCKDSDNAHYMIGWPKLADSKYIPTLLNEGYHIIIIEQKEDSPSTHKIREITNVISSGTALEYNTNDTNNLMSIYIENLENNGKIYHACGLSIIDLATGKSYITHILDDLTNNKYYEVMISHFMNIYTPSEIIIHNTDNNFNKQCYIQLFNIQHENVSVNFFNPFKKYQKIQYQNEFLSKIFKFNNMCSPIENIHCETKPETVLSYILLLEYVYQHRSNIINNLNMPEQLENVSYLNLTNNSIRQLNVISNNNNYKGRHDSLITIVNQCKTSLGKRLIRERLTHPMINHNNIQESYDLIDLFLKDEFYIDIRNSISKISDLEKTIRNMGIDMYCSDDLFSDIISYKFIDNTLKILKDNHLVYEKLINYQDHISNFYDFINDINNLFNWDNFNSKNDNNIIERSLFNINKFQEIDDIDLETYNNKKKLDYICERLSKFIDTKQSNNNNNPLPVKIEYTDKDNYYIYTTSTRGLKLKERFKNLNNKNINIKDEEGELLYSVKPESISFKSCKGGNVKIELDEIAVISNNLIKLNKQLSFLNNKYYKLIIKELYEKYHISLKEIAKLIASIDFYSNGAHISIKNRYYKPTLIESNKSFMNIKEIRHPIIELINDKHEYITNDISLGVDHDGVLLYGTNSCGKSSLMKAIGLNLILAQAGLFTASLGFEYSPYKKLFTRILNTDNIFSGHSSFVVEMNELRDVLYSADENSIVLADELAIGTETTSALSIVSSAIKLLCDKNVSFICTSHLHQLNNISIIQNIPNLKTYHLKITTQDDKIIYERVLEEGPGPDIYGLTVCQALNLGSDFISLARQVQMEINNENNNIINNKQSVYNKTIIMDICCMPVCENTAEETHHIMEQADADENNNFNHHHKNKAHNLIPLCKKCHAQITYGNLHIKGWKETSMGDILDYEYINNKQEKKSNKKFTENNIIIIKNYFDKFNSTLTKKKIIDKLLCDENIKIGMGTFNKIINNNY